MKKASLILLVLTVLFGFQNCGQPGVSFVDGGIDQASLGTYQTMTVDVKAESRVDLLFVVDNSSSMRSVQYDISNRLPGFISTINSLDWQIAVTTTSSSDVTLSSTGSLERWGNGNFRSLGGRGFLSKGDFTTAQAQNVISEAINVGVNGSGDERGINATYSAIGKSTSQADQKGFFRKESRLVIVLISDEDECSNGGCLVFKPTSNPDNLLKLVQSRFGSQKVFKFNSIVKTQNSICSALRVGSVYMDLSKKTGGIIGDVCASDYTSILGSIGQSTLDLRKSVNLPCVVEDAKVMNSLGAVVTGATASGATLVFAESLNEGSYTIQYLCK